MNVIKLLNDGSYNLEELVKRYRLVNISHPDLPLNVLNYTVKSPKFDVVTKECRSLVLNHEIIEGGRKMYHVAGKGFDRFFNIDELSKSKLNELNFDFENCTGTTKEDGSLMVLYHFDGEWRINTRYNYSEGKFSSGMYHKSMKGHYDENMTYKRLFKKIITKDETQSFEEIVSHLDPKVSYIFEMCSPQYNRIVKKYENIRLYLLSSIRIVGNENMIEELPLEYSHTLSEKIQVEFPEIIEIKSLEEAEECIRKKMKTDPSIEGLVLRDKDNKRLKIKNPGYIFLHNIRYDRLIEPREDDIIHFVLNCEEGRFFEVIEDLCKSKNNEHLRKQILEKFSEVKRIVVTEGFEITFKSNLQKLVSVPVGKSERIRKMLSSMKLRKMLSDYIKLYRGKKKKEKGDEEEEEGEEEEEDLLMDEENMWKHYKKYTNYILNTLFTKRKGKRGQKKSQTTRTMRLTELKGCSVNLELYRRISRRYLSESVRNTHFNNHIRSYSSLTEIEKKYVKEMKKKWKGEFNPHDPSSFFWEDNIGRDIKNDGLAATVPKEKEGEKGVWDVFCFCGKRMTLFVIPSKERVYKCIRESCKHCEKPKYYRNKFNAVYRCEACGTQHGCYQADVNRYTSTGVLQRSFPAKPFGIPCSTLALVFRHFAHEVFDTLYLEKKMNRPKAYEKLGELLGLEPKDVHVGLFPISRCIRTVQVVLEYKKKKGWL